MNSAVVRLEKDRIGFSATHANKCFDELCNLRKKINELKNCFAIILHAYSSEMKFLDDMLSEGDSIEIENRIYVFKRKGKVHIRSIRGGVDSIIELAKPEVFLKNLQTT